MNEKNELHFRTEGKRIRLLTVLGCVAIALYRDIGYDDQHQTSATMNEVAPQ